MLTELEEFEKEYKKQRVKIFKKYFLGQHIKIGLYNAVKNPVVKLTSVNIQFSIIYECIMILNQDKKYWNDLDTITKKEIQISIKKLNRINMILDKVLELISEDLPNLKTGVSS